MSQGLTTRSQALLSEPPDVREYSGMEATPSWLLTGQGPLVEFESALGTKSVIELQDQAKAMAILPWLQAGEITHFLIGFVNAAGTWSLFRFHDADGDTLPDVATKALLFDTGNTPAYITYIARLHGQSEIYLLDERCQDVFVARDGNGDGFPDTLQTTPFAESFQFPELLDGRMIVVVAAGQIDVPSGRFRVGNHDMGTYQKFSSDIYRLADTDQDGIADTISAWVRSDPAPRLYGRPFAGQTTLKIAGTEGASVEVWSVAEVDSAPISLLGAVTLSSDDWTALTLPAALVEDQKVRLSYATHPQDGAIHRVWKDLPQAQGVSERLVARTGDAVDMQGVNLSSSTVFRLRWGPDLGDSQLLSAVVHSSEAATVTIPALPATATGTAFLDVYDPTHAEEHSSVQISICDP